VNELEMRMNVLHAKQGAAQKFKSKQERDQWIKSQVKEHRDLLAKKNALVSDLQKDVAALEKAAGEVDKSAEVRRKESEICQQRLSGFEKEMHDLQMKRAATADESK
jgi:structural maintenance of chromosome 3 (chondroitin sulfate proteoglycan 6)